MEWDDKFGLMDKPHHEFDDLKAAKAVIEGVGQDAEIVTNSRGGKQSKSPMALHLIDPKFLKEWANWGIEMTDMDEESYKYYLAILNIADFMFYNDKLYLDNALSDIEEDNLQQLIRIARVLQVGASRYAPNNWRLIPQEEHINHALIHIIAHLAGDTQDEHLDHALCRLMMAYATEKSDDFDYGSYIKKGK